MENFDPNSFLLNDQISQPESSPIDPKLKNLFDRSLAEVAPDFRQESNPMFTRFPDQSFGLYELNYDRYARRSNFDELGFSPYRDNDALYNSESNFMGELWRGIQGAAMLTGSTGLDMIKGTMDLVTGDLEGFLAPDVSSAKSFEDINRVYGSTKGGTTGFISNGVLQAGFIGGMVLGSLPETVALGLLTAEAGGVGAWAKIAQTIGRGAKIADASIDAAKATKTTKTALSTVIQNTDSVAGAGKIASWLSTTSPSLKKITGNPILSFINPLENTTKYFDDMFTAVNAGIDLPSVKRGVGAVMRDGQIAKAAVVEASLEGGFITDAVKQKALNEFYEKNDRLPDEDELAVIESKALEAGARTTAWNMPVIMFTDKLLFAPMLKALDNTIARGVGSTLRKGVEKTATGYVGKTVAGKTLTETMKLKGKELAKSLLKPGTYLTRGKNFFTAGVGEGTQEVFQNIVGKTMEDYYGDILADPMNIPRSDIMGYFNETVSNIGAEEGEAFLSGMFVGGLFGSGSSKLVKYAKLAGPQFKTKDENGNMLPTYREKYQAYKEEQQRLNNELADTLNQAFSTPFQVFDKSIRSHADTKKLVAQFRLAEILGDEKVMRDVAEEIRFNKIFTTLETGTYDAFVSKLTALQQLDDAGVMEATGVDDATQARERLVKTVGRAGEIKNRYKEAKKKYPNPFDYSMYEYGTNSYNTTYMSHKSHEEAVRDYIFLGESIDKLKERNQSLKRTLAQTSIAPKISASEVDYLTSASLLNKEMALLKEEVLAEEAATTPEQKKLIANKNKRLTLLEDYQKKVNDFYEAESKGKGTKLKEKALKKSFDSVIKHINSVSEETVQYSEEAFNSSFSAVKDYFRNDIENGYLTRQLVTLDNPKSITEYSKRHFAAMNDVFVNKKKYIQRAINNFTSVAANNKVMHTLKEAGYAFDEKELAEYLENGTLPTQLISLKNGELVDATTEKVKTIVDSILAPFAEEKKAQNEEAAKRQAEEEKKKQVPETKVESEDVKRKKAFEALASMSPVQMDNAQRYKEMVVAQPELPVIMLEFLEQTNDKRSQDEFVASNDGTKFLAFAAELFKAKATSSFTQDSVLRYLASQEANNSQILNDAFDSYYKGAEYKELSSFIQLFVKPVKVIDFESQLLEGEEIVASYPDQDVYVLKLTDVSNEYGEGVTPDITYMAVNSQRGQIDAIAKSSEFGEGTFGTLESLLPIIEEYVKSGAVTTIAKAKNRFVFEGNILEKGQVIFNSRGTKYQVIDSIDVDPVTGTAKGVTIQKVGSKNRPEIIKSFNGYSLQSRLSVPEDATKLDVFEFGMIKRPTSISADDNVLITEFYASASKEEFLQSLVFQVVLNNQMSLEEKNIAFGGRSENVRVKQRSERARVEVYVQTPSGAKLLFGHINDPAQYAFYSADGVRYTNLNQSLVSSDIFVGKEIKPNVIVDNYNKSMSLYNRLMELSAGKDVTVIPYSELSSELSLNLTRPSYIFSGTDKTSFEKLKYKTYKGRTVVIDKVNGNTAEVITGAPFSLEELEKLNKTVRERTSSFENLGRYVLVSELPNGDVLFTELSSIQMTEQEVLPLIDELVSAVSDKKKRGENFASGFNSKFFFSYTGKDTYNNSNIKYAVRFEITNDGKFQIKFNPLNGTVKAEQTIRVERKFTNLQEFIDAVNEGIENNNKNLESSANLKYVQLAPISVDNFYRKISKNFSEADLNNTKSNVTDPEMISVGGIRIESFGPATISPSLMEMQNTPAPAVVRDEAEKVVIDNNIISEIEDKTNILQEQLLQKEAEYDQYISGLSIDDSFNNPVLEQLEVELNDLRQKVNQAYKVLEVYTPEEAEELVKFLSWVESSLPDFITVATVEQIADRMITEGITVGRFATIVKNATEGITGLQGVIEILEDSPAKYHEAFHSVFRMILTDREIQQALREGLSELRQELNKQGKTLDQLLNEYRVQPFYAQMTESELLDRVVEEHLSDNFEEFKKNPRETKTATTNKSVFRKIIDFLVSLFTDYKPRFESVEDLYEGISSGKFRKAGVADNKYTRAALNNGGDVAFAVMLNRGSVRVATGDTTEIIPQYLSSQDTQYVLSALSARVYNQLKDATEAVSLDSVMDSNIIDFAILFNPSRYSNVELKARAESIVMALKSPTNRAEIKEHVRNTIKTFDSVSSLLIDFQEEYEEEFGGNTSKQLGKSKEQLDGIKSLPPVVRALISTTPVREADAFGNEFFVDRQGNLTEERIIVPASVSFVYNSVSRLTADSVDEIEILNRLYSFTQLNSDSARNTHTVQFIERMFREFNIQPNESGEITREAIRNVKNARAYQAFIKAFDKSKRVYSFTAVDGKNNQSIVYEANRQTEDVTQYDNWRSAYNAKADSITDELAQEAESIMVDLVSYMKNLAIYDDKVSAIVDEKLARFAEITGIEMIPSFYEYSWYKNKIAENKLEVADANPAILAAVRTLKLPFITPDVLSQIGKSLKSSKGAELFVRETLDEGAANKTEYAVGGRVRSLAIGNVYFNESIDTTTFNNAEGNKIQTYQARTVFTKLVQNLRKGVPQDPYFEDNFLLSNEDFLNILSEITTESIDGMALRNLNALGTDFNRKAGSVYADYTDAEFFYQMLTNYFNVKLVNGVVTTPTFIRVLEAASTGMTVRLPVTKLVNITSSGYKLSNTAIEAVVKEIQRDVRAIGKARAEIDVIEAGTARFSVIEGYHNGLKSGEDYLSPRGLKLSHNMRALLGNEVSEKIEADKVTNSQLPEIVETALTAAFEAFKDKLVYNGLVNKRSGVIELGNKGPLISVMSTAAFKKSKAASYLDKLAISPVDVSDSKPLRSIKLEANLAQIFFSDFLNTLAFNQIIVGEHNKQFKDSKNVVKRAKGLNASGISTSHSTLAPELGINETFDSKGDLKHLTFQDGIEDGIITDDGQLYMTTKGLRHILHGMGRLSPKHAALIDKIKNGEDVLDSEVFGPGGSISYNGQTNSLKLVYYDGETYLKMSAFVLTKAFTERFSKGGFLENLRVVLENAEARGGVAFGHPQSASKSVVKNLVSREDINSQDVELLNKFNSLDPNYLYLSTETPSNKTEATDPTQMRSIVMSGFSESDSVYIDGVSYPAKDIVKEFMSLLAKRTQRKYFDRRENLFTIEDVEREFMTSVDLGKVTPKLEAFRKEAVETLKSIGATAQEIEIFERPDVNLNNPVTLNRFTTLFLSYFTKAVGKDTVPGYKLTLVSDAGITVKRLSNTAGKNGLSVDTVIPYRQYQAMSAAEKQNVYSDRLRHDVKVYDKKNDVVETYSEMIMPPHFAGKSFEDERVMHAVRIPSQASQSATNAKVVDYAPAYYGSIAFLPKELIKITGWDFDIDSIFVHRPKTYNLAGKDFIYGEEKTIAEKKAAYFNSLINNNTEYEDALLEYEDPFNQDLRERLTQTLGLEYSEEAYQSMPEYVDNRMLKIKTALQGSAAVTSAEEGQTPRGYQPMTTDAFDAFGKKLKEFASEFYQFIDASAGIHDSLIGKADAFGNIREGAENIGPAVNGVLAYSLLNYAKVSGSQDAEAGITINGVTYDGFTNLKDEKGNFVSDSLSQVVSVMVDNTNNPLARMYGLTLEQTGLAAYLTSLGVDLETVLIFINQPAVRYYATALKNARGTVKSSEEKSNPEEVFNKVRSLISQNIKGGVKEELTTQPSTSVKVISEPYGVVVAETNPTESKTKQFVDLIKPQIQAQAYQENVTGNQMFMYGLRWTRKKKAKAPLNNKSYANKGLLITEAKATDNYVYDTVDQNGNPLAAISNLQPIIDEIQRNLGIDMSNYDAVIGNIYLPGQRVQTHRDTTESLSARKYPVVVYTIGAGNAINVYENLKSPGSASFASDKKTTIPTQNGSIYTFGMDGKGRFELGHDTPHAIKKGDTQIPIIMPDGTVIKDYTITLTFRRAADLEPGMPTSPAKITSQPTQPSTSVKEGVAELFKNNPELANSVYEAMGFEQGSNLSEKEKLQKIAELNKGKTVSVKYDKYKAPFTATITGEIEVVISPTKLQYDDGRVEYKDDGIYNLQIKSSTGKILTANTFEITGLSELIDNQITLQQKQEAQQKFQEYVNQTGKQDIQGFKASISKSSTSVKQGVEISSNAKGLDTEKRLSANPVIEDLNYSSLLIEDAVKKMSQSELKNQLAILEQFDKSLKQAKIFANFSSLTKLNRGIGKTMENFERYIELADMFTTEEGIKEITSAGFPTNGLLAAIKNNPHIFSQIQAIRELNKFSRTLFISKTEAFEFVQDALKSSLTGNFLGEGLTKMKTDLLSVITAASYINTLQPGDRRALNLSNALIYERLRDGGNPSSSIVEVVNSLRSYYSKNNKRNRFVEDYLYTNSAKTSEGKVNQKNREQTNRVALNSWSRLPEDITDQLYRDFVDGLTNTDVLSDGTTVRSAFVDLVHYLLVKDGLNFKTGSFLSYVPAIALKEIFAANNKAIEVLKDFDGMLLKSSVTFGESLSKFVGEFMINWPKHASNNNYIKSLFKPEYGNTSEEAKIYDKLFEKVSEDRFNISLFGFKNGFSQEIDYNLEDEGYAEYLKLVSPVFSAGGMQTVNTPVGARTLFPLYLKINKDLYKLNYYNPSIIKDGGINDYITNGKISINSSNIAGVLNATKKDLEVNGFVGSFAQYEKVTVKGNRSQMGGGYIFGELPDYNLLEVDKTEASLKTPNVAAVPRTSPEAISNRASAVVNSISEMTSTEDPDSPVIPAGESNLASVGRRKKVPTSTVEKLSTYQLTDSDREALKKVYQEKSFTLTDVPESANLDMSDYASFMGYIQEALEVNKDIRNINDLADRIKTCYGITINL